MADANAIIFETVRPWLKEPGFSAPGRVEALNAACSAFRGQITGEPPSGPGLSDTGVAIGEIAQPHTWAEILAKLTNKQARALIDGDFIAVAASLGVTPAHIRASWAVESPRGAFDDAGRPSILFERHVFARNTTPKGRFNASNPDLSGGPYGPGGYGLFSAQYGKLERAFALDPVAAFEACSWGGPQVLGENAISLGYESAIAMAIELAKSEAAHLDCYARFVRHNGLVDELQACRPGNAASCIPFVERYNGPGWRQNNYAEKFAQAMLG
jgi:hypothetical protein